ncbi:MAG: RNA polymerase sigma factor [Dehalococcoidia bacterium]|nr:RNA polymerase sigma factor [Dehalococcoidia bacterium]
MSEINNQNAVLVVRCQLGERAAWDELVYRWHQPMWRFIFSMLGDRQVAEDILQIVWLRVVQSLLRLREPVRFEAWLYRIARNVIADRMREQYRRPFEEVFREAVCSDRPLESLDVTDSLHNALGKLHPIDRETVVLYYLEEKSLDEVAGICEAPSGTIKSRLHRARRQLREALTNEEHRDE